MRVKYRTRPVLKVILLSFYLALFLKPSLVSVQATQTQGPVKDPQKVEQVIGGNKLINELFEAISQNNLEKLKELMVQGVDVHARDSKGHTPLRYAVYEGNRKLVELLIDRGADISSIHRAVCAGDLIRVRSFIEQGADINAKGTFGWTILFWAVSMGQVEIAEYLLANDTDISMETDYGYVLLYQAAQSGSV